MTRRDSSLAKSMYNSFRGQGLSFQHPHWHLTTAHNSSSRGSEAIFWPHQTPELTCTKPHTNTHIHTSLKVFKFFLYAWPPTSVPVLSTPRLEDPIHTIISTTNYRLGGNGDINSKVTEPSSMRMPNSQARQSTHGLQEIQQKGLGSNQAF